MTRSLRKSDCGAQSVYVDALLYVVIISLAKFSVLCFYRRIFGSPVKLGISIIFLLQTIWAIVCIFLSIFRCKPIAGSWNVAIPAKCLSFELIVIAAEPFNCALDFLMVALPVKVIRTLQLSMKRKILLSGIFALGSL